MAKDGHGRSRSVKDGAASAGTALTTAGSDRQSRSRGKWGGGAHQSLEPRATAFQADVPLGSTWNELPDRFGPTTSHLHTQCEALMGSTWNELPDRFGPTISHLQTQCEALMGCTWNELPDRFGPTISHLQTQCEALIGCTWNELPGRFGPTTSSRAACAGQRHTMVEWHLP